jgi:hypothetical protein
MDFEEKIRRTSTGLPLQRRENTLYKNFACAPAASIDHIIQAMFALTI